MKRVKGLLPSHSAITCAMASKRSSPVPSSNLTLITRNKSFPNTKKRYSIRYGAFWSVADGQFEKGDRPVEQLV